MERIQKENQVRMNITDFKSAISAHGGLSNSNEFEFRITPPGGMSDPNNIIRDIRFFCDSAQLPGVAFQTNEFSQMGYGPLEKRPTNALFEESQVTFMSDANSDLVAFFHEWFRLISNFQEDNKYEFHDNYVTTGEVTKFNSAGEKVYMWKLLNMYPTTFPSTGVDWNTTDEIVKYSVSFTYRSWEAQKLNGVSA